MKNNPIDNNSKFDADKAWNNVTKAVVRKKRIRIFRLSSVATVTIAFIAVGSLFILNHDVSEKTYLSSQELTPRAVLHFTDGQSMNLGDESESDFETLVKKKDKKNVAKKVLTIEQNILEIPKGMSYRLILPDGTKVWLNSDSRLTFPSLFKAKYREVILTGQAFFDVHHDPEHPFIVHTSLGQVEVKGTSFDLKVYKEDKTMETTLVEGKVDMKIPLHTTTKLTPGQRVVFDKENNQISNEEVDTDLYTSWVKGIFVFEDKTLKDISKELERWYDVDILWDVPQLGDVRFSGQYSKEDSLTDVLNLLGLTGRIKYEINNQQVIFTSR